jgi:hypothetical protein
MQDMVSYIEHVPRSPPELNCSCHRESSMGPGGDIRDVISIRKLVRKNDGPEEVEQILSTMIKYENIN